jgi:hypothetical protein
MIIIIHNDGEEKKSEELILLYKVRWGAKGDNSGDLNSICSIAIFFLFPQLFYTNFMKLFKVEVIKNTVKTAVEPFFFGFSPMTDKLSV